MCGILIFFYVWGAAEGVYTDIPTVARVDKINVIQELNRWNGFCLFCFLPTAEAVGKVGEHLRIASGEMEDKFRMDGFGIWKRVPPLRDLSISS